jgi:ABC-type polysaccharide/polyol phosphate export permease
MTNTQAFTDMVSREFVAGFRASQIWGMLGWDDIRQRYRRSVLGPIWITLSMGVFTLLLGVIYAELFHIDVATYLPFLSLGYIVWGFISQTTNESCRAFQEGERILKQIKLPYAVYVLRIVWRNVIVFFHTIVIYIPIAIIFAVKPNLYSLLALPGLLLIYVNQVWISFTLAILCSRYRDVLQVVSTAIQIMLFATPIMWPRESLGKSTWIADINPLYHWIELVRAPILGHVPGLLSWAVSIATAIVGTGIALALLNRAARRLVFWI